MKTIIPILLILLFVGGSYALKVRIATKWEEDKSALISEMDEAIKLRDFSTVFRLHDNSDPRAKRDSEISIRYMKAVEIRDEFNRKQKELRVAELESSIALAEGRDRSSLIEQLSKIDPKNEKFKNELLELKEERRRDEIKKKSTAYLTTTTTDSYDNGYSDGYLVGRADARDGRSRRGVWAKQNGERLSSPGSNYSKGYHLGYNEGYHSY